MVEASKEAMELTERIVAVEIPHHAGRKDVKESIANAIDAHTAAKVKATEDVWAATVTAKQAEIERWKREAMAVREAEQRGQVFNERFFWAVNMTHGDRAKIEAARAANGATP